MEKSSFAKLIDIRKERKPSCTLCSNHGIRSSLKGHKHNCPFLRCHCERCVKGRLKRDIMKQQVRLRRKQMKDIVNHPYCGTPVESLGKFQSFNFAVLFCCCSFVTNVVFLFANFCFLFLSFFLFWQKRKTLLSLQELVLFTTAEVPNWRNFC